jgi:hypothetical protein
MFNRAQLLLSQSDEKQPVARVAGRFAALASGLSADAALDGHTMF